MSSADRADDMAGFDIAKFVAADTKTLIRSGNVDAWTQSRFSQCSQLFAVLVKDGLMTPSMVDDAEQELRTVFRYIIEDPTLCDNIAMGSAAFWAIAMCQRHNAFLWGGWVVDSANASTKWTMDALWDIIVLDRSKRFRVRETSESTEYATQVGGNAGRRNGFGSAGSHSEAKRRSLRVDALGTEDMREQKMEALDGLLGWAKLRPMPEGVLSMKAPEVRTFAASGSARQKTLAHLHDSWADKVTALRTPPLRKTTRSVTWSDPIADAVDDDDDKSIVGEDAVPLSDLLGDSDGEFDLSAISDDDDESLGLVGAAEDVGVGEEEGEEWTEEWMERLASGMTKAGEESAAEESAMAEPQMSSYMERQLAQLRDGHSDLMAGSKRQLSVEGFLKKKEKQREADEKARKAEEKAEESQAKRLKKEADRARAEEEREYERLKREAIAEAARELKAHRKAERNAARLAKQMAAGNAAFNAALAKERKGKRKGAP